MGKVDFLEFLSSVYHGTNFDSSQSPVTRCLFSAIILICDYGIHPDVAMTCPTFDGPCYLLRKSSCCFSSDRVDIFAIQLRPHNPIRILAKPRFKSHRSVEDCSDAPNIEFQVHDFISGANRRDDTTIYNDTFNRLEPKDLMRATPWRDSRDVFFAM